MWIIILLIIFLILVAVSYIIYKVKVVIDIEKEMNEVVEMSDLTIDDLIN